MSKYNVRRLNHLLAKHTAFRSLADLLTSVAGGYTPTIICRTCQHGELVRLLRDNGVAVRV
jgi:hypothetical protein